MGKKELHNLITFDDFSKRQIKGKPTERTEVGVDVLNEHFFDRLAYRISVDDVKPEMVDEVVKRIGTACRSGQVKDLKEMTSIADEMERKIRKDRGEKVGEEDFSVQTPDQLLGSVNTILNIVNLVVVGIAASPAFFLRPRRPRGWTWPRSVMSGRSYRIQAALALSMTLPPPTAKIMSVCASGRKNSFCLLSPRPLPVTPPEPKAIQLWMIWKPVLLGSSQGLRNARMRRRR